MQREARAHARAGGAAIDLAVGEDADVAAVGVRLLAGRDENDAVIGKVPNVSGFFSQGETHEEARSNLREVIEGNVLVALQLGWEVPTIPGVEIEELDVEADTSSA